MSGQITRQQFGQLHKSVPMRKNHKSYKGNLDNLWTPFSLNKPDCACAVPLYSKGPNTVQPFVSEMIIDLKSEIWTVERYSK